MTEAKQPEALRALAESAAWTGRWYDAGCNTVHCTYDKEESIEHDEIAHPVPLGVSGYIAAAHPQAVIALLDRIAELEAQLSAIGAGGVEPLRPPQCLHGISEPSGWRDIETAPKDAQYVLLRGKREQDVASGYWLQSAYAGNGAWIWPFVHRNPILWAPLPPSPSSADEGGSNG